MVHLSEHVDRVGVERQIGCINDTEGIQLMSQRTLTKHELCRIRPIEAVYAVRPAYTVLH